MWYEQDLSGDFISFSVHPLLALVAAAAPDGRIDLFNNEGERNAKAAIRRDARPCLLAWHPTRKLLSVSWANGTVAIWSDYEQVLREGNIHQVAVSCVEWSPNGARLVTADEDGEVVVWKVDQRGRLSSICQYRLKDTVTHCLFRTLKHKESKPSECPPFFLAGRNGTIHYADDMGHCSEGLSISSAIISLMMFELKEAVVVINEDLVLSQYQLSADGKLTQELEVLLYPKAETGGGVKLSAGARVDKKAVQAIWVAVGVLALCFGGNTIRIWDMVNEENHVLSLP
ncbi:WD40-repeat-containing domain protein, partial [Blyttiomyces helicus]